MNDKFENLLDSGIRNIVQSFHDSFVETNAKFRAKAGLKVTIVRESIGECCSWCSDLAGTYSYDNAPKDIYARHLNCSCVVSTKTEKGTWQDAHSRKEYKTFRENRIARAEEIEKNGKITESPEIKEKAALLAQSPGDSIKPKVGTGDFSDFKQLEISIEEKEKLIELNRLAKDTGFEHGRAICDGKWTEIETEHLHNRITIHYPTNSRSVNLFHSHTDDSVPSAEDFVALTRENINRINVVSVNGDTWIVDSSYGIKPSKYELRETMKMLYQQSAVDMKENPFFSEWTPEERYYMLIKEQMIRVSRYYEWDVMGGNLYG